MLLMSLVERTEHLLKGRQVVGTPIREVSRTVKLHWRSRQLDSAAGLSGDGVLQAVGVRVPLGSREQSPRTEQQPLCVSPVWTCVPGAEGLRTWVAGERQLPAPHPRMPAWALAPFWPPACWGS